MMYYDVFDFKIFSNHFSFLNENKFLAKGKLNGKADFSLNLNPLYIYGNLEMVKAVTMAFCSIQ